MAGSPSPGVLGQCGAWFAGGGVKELQHALGDEGLSSVKPFKNAPLGDGPLAPLHPPIAPLKGHRCCIWDTLVNSISIVELSYLIVSCD